MKKMFFAMSLIFCVTLIHNTVWGDFYVIAGSKGVGKEIKSLPYTISSPGFYYITKNLTCPNVTHGITINVGNVTLDLMGFSLVGPRSSIYYDGIHLDGTTNVEIRNGTIRDFPGNGIYEYLAVGSGHRIINVRLLGNRSGIRLVGSGHLVERCTSIGNQYDGIWVGFGSTVSGNTCYDNDGDGIYAGTGSTVIGNTCHSNSGYGISLQGNNLVDQNSFTNNTLGNIGSCGTCVFGTNVPAVP